MLTPVACWGDSCGLGEVCVCIVRTRFYHCQSSLSVFTQIRDRRRDLDVYRHWRREWSYMIVLRGSGLI